MDVVFKIRGVQVELIEAFRDMILVQCILTKEIFLAPYWDVDPHEETGYNNCDEVSNVVSLRGWLSCRKNEKEIKLKKLPPKQQLPKVLPSRK